MRYFLTDVAPMFLLLVIIPLLAASMIDGHRERVAAEDIARAECDCTERGHRS